MSQRLSLGSARMLAITGDLKPWNDFSAARRYATMGQELPSSRRTEGDPSAFHVTKTSGGILLASMPAYNYVTDACRITEQKRGQSVTGVTDLFRNGEFAGRYLHGGDFMYPLGLLAQKLLKRGERVSAIGDIRFSEPIVRNLTLTVSREPLRGDPNEPASVRGFLITSKRGREEGKLYFRAIQNGEAISREAYGNPVAEDIMPVDMEREDVYLGAVEMRNATITIRPGALLLDSEECGTGHRFKMQSSEQALSALQAAPHPGLLLSTTFDVLTNAGQYLLHEALLPGSAVGYIARVRDLKLLSPKDLTRGGYLQARGLEQQFEAFHPGFTVVPITVEFLSRTGIEKAAGTVYFASS
jgi:hypothetical protein